MEATVDARGMACPQPVLLTLKAMAASDRVTTVVDNAAAVENVTRLAHSKGFSVDVAERADGVYLALVRGGVPTEQQAACSFAEPASGPLVLFVPGDSLGRGPAELGERLMGAFFHSLLEVAPKPKTIIFMNAGAKLAVEGSRALEDLRALAGMGVDVLVCGTCLGYFELTEKLAVGRVSNMYDIATLLLEAGKIVEL